MKMKQVKIKKVEEKKLLRFDCSKMIDVVALLENEPELFEELYQDYPVKDGTSILFNVKED